MLVLSRKPGEQVRIGDDITVVVLETRGDKVRLGFSAPADVAIHRQEVAIKIEQEERQRIARQRLAEQLSSPGKAKQQRQPYDSLQAMP